MKAITSLILKIFIKDYSNVEDPSVRSKYGALEGWVSVVVNIILFIIKFLLGVLINSVSLIADAFHTLSDMFTSFVVLFGFKLSQKPPDKEHPFGHGRMEPVSALIMSVLLFVAGIEFFQKSFYRILNPDPSHASVLIIAIIFATLVIKELLARFAFILGDAIDSQALKVDGYHHRCDAVTTIFVLIAMVASRYGLYYIDGVMGVFVSLAIMYSGYLAGKEAIDPLLGAAVSKEILLKIEKIAKAYEGVLGVHDIIYQSYGQTRIISLHLEVSDKEDVNKLHILSEEVEEAISESFGGVVVAHIDPVNREHPLYDNIYQTISEIVSNDNRVKSFHELRIVGKKIDKCNVVFDIALNDTVDDSLVQKVKISIANKFKSKYPHMRVVINAEPRYVYNL